MDRKPLVSVLINNYNYGRFLREAIDSALNQTYPHMEVVVVDDGSTDDSRQIIASYGDRILPVLKENRGQSSAMNAGFAKSRGELICFLDADDLFERNKVATVVNVRNANDQVETALIFHSLKDVKADGHSPVPGRRGTTPRWRGNYYHIAQTYHYAPFTASHPSGVSVTRSLADTIFPLPEGFLTGGDNFLVRASGLLGEVIPIDETLARYRIHGNNHWHGRNSYKPRDFLETEERFLNQRLTEAGLDPSLNFFSSVASRNFYRCHGQPADLYHLVGRVIRNRRDPVTLRFALKTVAIATREQLKRTASIQLRSHRGPGD